MSASNVLVLKTQNGSSRSRKGRRVVDIVATGVSWQGSPNCVRGGEPRRLLSERRSVNMGLFHMMALQGKSGPRFEDLDDRL